MCILLVFLIYVYHDARFGECKVWRISWLADLLDFQGDCSVELDVKYGNRKLCAAVAWAMLSGNLALPLSLCLSLCCLWTKWDEGENVVRDWIDGLEWKSHLLGCEDLYRTPDDDLRNSVYLHGICRSTEFCWPIIRKSGPMRDE